MPIKDVYTFSDLIKPRRIRLRRNLDSARISQFRYAAENEFPGAGLAIGAEFPIYEFSRTQRWVKVEIPGSYGRGFLKLTENEVLSYFSVSY